jgi:hypothetical protein
VEIHQPEATISQANRNPTQHQQDQWSNSASGKRRKRKYRKKIFPPFLKTVKIKAEIIFFLS